MATAALELVHSRRWSTGDATSIELIYTLTGTSDDVEAKNFALNESPSVYEGYPRQGVDVEPTWIDTDNEDGCRWYVVAHYGLLPIPGPGSFVESFDTSGGIQHVTNSLHTVNVYSAPGAEIADFKGGIGVTKDQIEGVDLVLPVYQFAETWIKTDAEVDVGYRSILVALTGQVNMESFRGLAKWECLFIGATGAKRSQTEWEITYRFAGRPTVNNLKVGDIVVGEKRGWDYMWIVYKDVVDGASKRVIKVPDVAYVERVYKGNNFWKLGLGTGATPGF